MTDTEDDELIQSWEKVVEQGYVELKRILKRASRKSLPMEQSSLVPNPLYNASTRFSATPSDPPRLPQQQMMRWQKRPRTNIDHRWMLEDAFKSDPNPTNVAVIKLAFETGMTCDQVKNWFRKRRWQRRQKASSKLEASSLDPGTSKNASRKISLNATQKTADLVTRRESTPPATIVKSLSQLSNVTLIEIKGHLRRLEICPMKRLKELLYRDWEVAASHLLSLAMSDIPLVAVVFKEAKLLKELVLPTWPCLRFRQEEVVCEWMETFLISSRPISVQKEEELRAVLEFIVVPWVPIYVYAKLIFVDGKPVGLSRAIWDASMMSENQVACEFKWQVPTLIEAQSLE